MKKGTYSDVDDALDLFMREARARDCSISGPILIGEAQDLASKLGHDNFKGSQGWLTRFKQRKGIHFLDITGEAHSVDPAAVDAWKTTLLVQLLQDYKPEDCLASCNPPSQAEEMDEMWNHLGALEKFLTKSFAQKQKQATILNFFTPPSAAGPLMPEEEPRV